MASARHVPASVRSMTEDGTLSAPLIRPQPQLVGHLVEDAQPMRGANDVIYQLPSDGLPASRARTSMFTIERCGRPMRLEKVSCREDFSRRY